MDLIIILAIALGFAVGVGLTYLLLKEQMNKQKKDHAEQIEKTILQLEKSHESRMQLTIQSLQEHYYSQLSQATELLEKDFELKAIDLRQQIEECAKTKALEEFNFQRDKLEKTFEEKYQVELAKWKTQSEKSIRQSSLSNSRNAIKGRVSEQLLPLLAGLQYSPGDMRFIGSPIDYIIFDGYDEAKENSGQIKTIILADVKRGSRAKLSPIQLKIKAAVDALRVRWETITIDENLQISIGEKHQVQFQSVHPNLVNENLAQSVSQNPQNLCQKIVAWGNSGKIEWISNLINYANHPEANVRRLTASAIGKIASSNTLVPEIEQAIPALNKLTQDEKPQVRQYAIKALAVINSEEVVPLLKIALHDPVGYVSEAAKIGLRKRNLSS